MFSSKIRLSTGLNKVHSALLTSTVMCKADHLVVTKNKFREKVISDATVVHVQDVSATVKLLTLKIVSEHFTFKAGQWVDAFIPGVSTVGGFSICSSPDFLQRCGMLLLAVKLSTHPPAHWVHRECKAEDILRLRVGGDYYFDPSDVEVGYDLLLLAGGVGINPLVSILNHVVDLNNRPAGPYRGKVLLLYSAKTDSDFIFKSQLDHWTECHKNIEVWFYRTRGHATDNNQPSLTAHRIGVRDIQASLRHLQMDVRVFLCGPEPMIAEMKTHLLTSDIPAEHLFHEQWW